MHTLTLARRMPRACSIGKSCDQGAAGRQRAAAPRPAFAAAVQLTRQSTGPAAHDWKHDAKPTLWPVGQGIAVGSCDTNCTGCHREQSSPALWQRMLCCRSALLVAESAKGRGRACSFAASSSCSPRFPKQEQRTEVLHTEQSLCPATSWNPAPWACGVAPMEYRSVTTWLLMLPNTWHHAGTGVALAKACWQALQSVVQAPVCRPRSKQARLIQ